MAGFPVEFSANAPSRSDDGRLDAPAARRNSGPITEVLVSILGSNTGHMIEVGSGTGQHVSAFAQALPQLTWWPTDPSPVHRRSIEAWRHASGLGNIMAPVALDAATDWQLGRPGRPPEDGVTAIVCINVVHISPWAVTEGLFRQAGRVLRPGGWLILYGPYSVDGEHTAPSNAAFDASLRATDPAWGVRDIADIKALAASTNLTLRETIPMPANNLILALAVA